MKLFGRTKLFAIGLFCTIHLQMMAGTPEKSQLLLSNLFNNGMVMQRGEKIPVWGFGTPGAKISVSVSGKKVSTVVDAEGHWSLTIPSLKVGGPYSMIVKDGNSTVEVNDILVGDVYLCSGQSNMELPIRRCMDNKNIASFARSYTNNQIRYLKLPHQFNYVRPNQNVRVLPWQNITPQNSAEVGALCYFFAKQMQEESGVPVGIINSSVGGTPVEAWMPKEVLATYKGYKEELDKKKYTSVSWPDSIARDEREAGAKWERTMVERDSIVHRWKSQDYDFSAWKSTDVFSDWGKSGNGSYWFRNTLVLPSYVSGKEGQIRLGALRDADSVFVNGIFVGFTSYQYPPRIYKIPSGVLREGENEVVVHLMSQHDTPRFVPQKLYQIEVDNEIFKLSSIWQMQIGTLMPERPSDTYFVAGYTGLYNAMISPLRNYPIKGMVWYQGEANMDNTSNYSELLQGMVAAWRKQWGKEFPVVVVQLPSYMDSHEQPIKSGWTDIRWQQYLAVESMSKSALVPTLDTGESTDIHPQEKDIIGGRIAKAMSALVKGKSVKGLCGPKPLKVKIEGSKVRVTFDTPLSVNLGTMLRCFAVETVGCYVWANAVVVSPTEVELTIPQARPFKLLYGWDDFVHPKLFDMQGTPSPQFQITIK